MAEGEVMRMNAYYYSFEPTGHAGVDKILSAVASAGKASHSTEDWNEDYDGSGSSADLIQQAANAAAELALKADAEIKRLQRIEAAAKALIKGKGRFHTEQNMRALIDAVNDGVNK